MINEHLYYLSRYALVELKRTLHLPVKGDKKHFCARIIRGVRAGRIHPGTVFTAIARRDGFGSQVLSRLTIQATARDIGVDYVHTPFGHIAHSEGDPDTWSARCEAAFNLGEGLRRRDEVDLPLVDFRDYALRPDLWAHPHMIEFSHLYEHCDRYPDLLRDVVRPQRSVRQFTSPRLTLAVHVRRGDVSPDMTSERYVSADRIFSTAIAAEKALAAAGFECDIHIYSNGDAAEFSAFANHGMRLHLDLGALETFEAIKKADVLMTAKSTFSYDAGLYSDGLVIYDRFPRPPLSGWVEIGRKGGFAEEAFQRALAPHLPAGS
ncbi:hypothetical protein HGO38_21310 [Rhizobium sp. CG5]|uniref:hypothetical protein n=1 Tax=Rhizobium sp. CG5 TaxID=2726076 RepID=UPI0020338BD8|nr:hypothetical protein [Rhizobium sp. CG5]MCM2476018.1 hypothetical protein [Rhizobium sp. CG5]